VSLPWLALAGAATASGWPYAFVALAAEAAKGADSGGAVILLREGDRPEGGGGLPVASLGMPATGAGGEVAFTGNLDDAGELDGFVWRGGKVVFRNSEAGLVGASPTMGIGATGEFVFQSSLAGKDVIWSQQGLVVREGDPAPGFPAGAVLEISRRPSMLRDGRAFWVSEFRDGPGGKGKGRVLYRSSGPSPAQVEVVLRSDDLVAGFPLARPRGLDWNYDFSDDGNHLIQVVQLVTGSTADDDAVYLDGALAAREGEPTGDGDRWTRFVQVAVNGRGDSLFSAETDGADESDVVVAFNGRVVLREGKSLGDEAKLPPQANVLALALDERGRAVQLWSVGGFGAEVLLFFCDVAHLENAIALVRTPQPLDTDATPGPDTVLVAFADVGHGPALSLGESNRIWLEAEINSLEPSPPGRREAIVGLRLPVCPADRSPD
jgi:hypothetical protein